MSHRSTPFSILSPDREERAALATVARYLSRVESATATQLLANGRSRNLEWASLVRDQCLSFSALCTSLIESFDQPRNSASDPSGGGESSMPVSRRELAT